MQQQFIVKVRDPRGFVQRALSLPCNGELILEGGCSVYAWIWIQMVMSQGTNSRTLDP